MSATTGPSRTVVAAVTGACTTLYYACPDVVRSRAARGWLKASLTAAVFAVSVPDLRAVRTERRLVEPDGVPSAGRELAAMPLERKVVGSTVGAAVLALAVRGLVAAERWIFRRGEMRAAAGDRMAHTRAAVVLGALAAALALVPPPAGASEPVEDPRR